jgi:hypothetical protein
MNLGLDLGNEVPRLLVDDREEVLLPFGEEGGVVADEDLLGRGYTVDQVLHQYEHLTPDDVQACLAYAADVLQSEKVYALR